MVEEKQAGKPLRGTALIDGMLEVNDIVMYTTKTFKIYTLWGLQLCTT